MRQEIERTREQMSSTIDAIADRTSPGRIIARQRRRFGDRLRSARETVMGTAEEAYGSAQERARSLTQGAQQRTGELTGGVADAQQKAGELAGDVVDELRQAPEELRRRAQGNPLAAGLIAFGGGLLVASVLPSTRQERQATERLQQEAKPAVQQLKQAGQEVAQEVKTTAQHAAEEVKDKATESARRMTDEAKGSAEQVQEQARASAEQVAERTKNAVEKVRSGDEAGGETTQGELYERPSGHYTG